MISNLLLSMSLRKAAKLTSAQSYSPYPEKLILPDLTSTLIIYFYKGNFIFYYIFNHDSCVNEAHKYMLL